MKIKLTRRELIKQALPTLNVDAWYPEDFCLLATCDIEDCDNCPLFDNDNYLDEEIEIEFSDSWVE